MIKQLEYPYESDLLCKIKKIRKELLQQDFLVHQNVAILSGSTIGQLGKLLEIFLLNQGISPTIFEGNYNSYYDEAVFGSEKLDEFSPDVVYIHTSVRNILDWPNASDSDKTIESKLDELVSKYARMWDTLQSKYDCVIIQNNFEMLPYRILGNMDSVLATGRQYYIEEANRRLRQEINKRRAVFLNDVHYQSAYYGLERWFDDSDWCAFKYPFSRNAFPLVAHNIANIIKSYYGKNKKAIVLDLDNTLWKGIIGENGVSGIQLGIETSEGILYSEFQQYLKEIKDRGIALIICSKNEEDAAKLGLTHPSSVLKLEDFAFIICNWKRKSSNILSISKLLNLNPDSFVFVDDNPAERQEVKENINGITVLNATDISDMKKILDGAGYFEITNFSSEDIKRNNYYKTNLIRKTENIQENYTEYLKKLNMQLQVASIDEKNIERVTQLLYKTNQFNLTGLYMGQRDILKFSEDNLTICGTLLDRYGNNGLVSVLLGKFMDNNIIKIVSWVMSCRVFNRNLEFAMFDQLVKYCQEKEVCTIYGTYIPTTKNVPVSLLYKELGFSFKMKQNNQEIWEYVIPQDYKKKNTVIQMI